MSDPLRIGFVVEGPTDHAVLEAVVGEMLGQREFVSVTLQPIVSDAFSTVNSGGWTSVYLWSKEMAEEAGGHGRDSSVFRNHDIVVMQIDADVAGMCYTDDTRIQDPPNDLPFQAACPPASNTTVRLRSIMLNWINEQSVPPKLVLCTPSKSLETWVLVALFPQNRIAAAADVECRQHPEAQLQAQPVALRLVRRGRKDVTRYRAKAPDIASAWGYVRQRCTEADRFSRDFQSVVPPG